VKWDCIVCSIGMNRSVVLRNSGVERQRANCFLSPCIEA